AFADAVAELKRTGLGDAFVDAVHSGKPCLGVCLGLQLLFDVSEEDGEHAGLGLLPGRIVKFDAKDGLKIPHMGWNTLSVLRQVQGDYDRETVFGDDPAAMATKWVAEGAKRLHLVDLDGAKSGRPVNVEAVRSILDAVKVPCQIGGGIRDDETAAAWLDSGI